MNKLKISDTLNLPVDFVTQTQAILAKKGVGKSYTATVQAEELLEAKQQIIVIDIVGAWHGLLSSADGKSAGYPVVIAGGEHGHIPLEPTSGELLATEVVSRKFSLILDLSLLRKNETTRFLGQFLSTLYRLNRSPVHLFADEADYYAPQKPFGDQAVTLGAMEDVVRRGRQRGIGVTLITQRPQVLNKNVLTQCEILTTLRIVHHKDIAAIKEWIDVHADHELAKEMISSLPSLPIGTAWIWSPAWPDDSGIFQRVKIRKKITFDSGRTPKAGEVKSQAKVLAKVDIEQLGANIKQTVQEIKQNDPKALKAEIIKLRKQIETQADVKTAQTKAVSLDIALLMKSLVLADKTIKEGFEKINLGIAKIIEDARYPIQLAMDSLKSEEGRIGMEVLETKQPPGKVEPLPRTQRPLVRHTDLEGLGKCEAAILKAFYWNRNEKVTPAKIAFYAGYSVTSSSYSNGVSKLRTAGFVHNWEITLQGEEFIRNTAGEKPRGWELREWLRPKLGKAENKILDVLLEDGKDRVAYDFLSSWSGYSQTSSSFSNALSKLRSIEAIHGTERDGGVLPNEVFFN